MSLPSTPISITPSASELRNGQLSQCHLEVALRAIHRDGLIVIENLVDHDTIDHLNGKMVVDAYNLQGRKDSPSNYNKGNIQQDPPMTEEWFGNQIYTNHFDLFGPQSRTALHVRQYCPSPNPPASQPIHNDADFDHLPIPFALVVNVPLVTMTPENGSTEVWLGTHTNTTIADQEGAHGDRASGRNKQDLLEARRAVRSPCQPVVKKGSIIVRDLRLWHRGKPNYTSEPRVMLAMIHFASWYRNSMEVEFANELADHLNPKETGLQVAATYVTQEQLLDNYLNRSFGNAYDFKQSDRVEAI